MKTRTIAIIVSVFAAVILLFFSVLILVVAFRNDVRNRHINEQMKLELPSEGIMMRYSEGLYPDYELLPGDDYTGCDEDNIQITVFADGTAQVKYIPPEEIRNFKGMPPVLETDLPDENFTELKKRIDESGIRIISDMNQWSADWSAYPSVSVVSGENSYLVTEKMCENSASKYPVQSRSCTELIHFASDMIRREDREKFDTMVSKWKAEDNMVFDFSEPPNDYISEGDFDGVSMFRYYEELYGVDDPTWQGFQTCLSVDASGRVSVMGSYSTFDKEGEDRFEEYKAKAKTKISRDDLERMQELIQECHFEKYSKEINVGYEVPAEKVKGDFRVVCFFTVACNGTKYYAVDDGSIPELRQLIQKYLDITTNGIKAEEAYSTTSRHWEELTKNYEEFILAE